MVALCFLHQEFKGFFVEFNFQKCLEKKKKKKTWDLNGCLFYIFLCDIFIGYLVVLPSHGVLTVGDFWCQRVNVTW